MAPVITCPFETISLECGEPIPPLYTILDSFLANGGIAEDCCIDSASFFGTESSEMAGGMVTITQKYFISDCCGHMDSCTIIITIPPCELDLAIKKEINAPTPFFTSIGGIIPFKITVYNQFEVPADSIKLIDYLPSNNSIILTPGWINNGNGSACYTISRANGLLPATGLLMGDSVVVFFDVKLGADALNAQAVNTAEIFSAQDTFHNTLDDIDSDPNSVPGDDAGGVPDGESDDAIGGNGSGNPGVDDPDTDEDDQDPALFYLCQPFVCNDKINVSLDLNCQHCFSPLDIIKGSILPESFYVVELFGPDGKKLETNCIGREYLGYKLTLSVSSIAPCPPNKCWGIVTLEDKMPPSIDCNIIDTVNCFEIAALPKGSFTIKDNCSGEVKVDVIAEQFVDYGCDSAIQGKIFRTLVARDVWGNVTNCTKQYVIAKITLDSVICPRDTVFECGVPDSILATAGVPTVRTYGGKIVKLTGNSPSCKITVLKKDEKTNICGNSYKIYRTWIVTDWCTGQEKWCKQWIEVIDRTAPIVTNKTLPAIASDPHDCGQYVKLDTLVNTDCSRVAQTYTVSYKNENGIIQVINGTLPESRIWLPAGAHEIQVNLLDDCQNQSKGWIRVVIIDQTPPTPVCDEFTQVTLDPTSCWAVVSAKDLDNGSHDNCVTKLHFAAALMSDIEKARSDYAIKIEADCGKDEYWNNKSWYDAYIEEWINCYVFKDTVKFSDCGSNQVVLRVYEADSIPRLDPHLFSCGPHAWFCYNTYQNYRIGHNASSQSCIATGPWLCKTASDTWYSSRSTHAGAFYIGSNPYPTRFPVYTHLYNDCMVNVLVDDKQAPVVYGLEDIVVYCDNAPEESAYARNFCEKSESYTTWPGDIKDGLGRIHGYYGGSENVNTHAAADDHLPGTGCDLDKWSPIYCRKWLLLDSFDNAGKIDPKTYFDKVVLFDKNRPTRTLAGNEFSFTDNCSLVDSTLKENITQSINGCGEGWLQKTWTIMDKCGNAATATQKVIVKHRSDFEVVFPKDLDVICGPGGNATDTGNTGKPIISDDECEQIGVQYKDEISTVEEEACYKIIRTWTLIDWCIYDPNAHTTYPDVIVDDRLRANLADRACVFRNIKDNGDGYIKYVQIIKVKDTVAPKLTCKDTSICITSNCSVFFTMPLAGTDNCAAKVNFRTVMTKPDNSTETKTNVSAITGSFISGTYNFAVYGNDGCGNESACNIKVEVKDCKAPTPYCLDALATVVMPSAGSIEIWAREFNVNSEDNCTPKDKLKYSFTKNTADANKILTCKDITNGREKTIPLDIYVTDEAGNSDFCKVVLSLQDNGGAPGGVCPDNLAAVANVTGKLYTESKEGIEHATVIMKGENETYKTKSDGAYAFKEVYMVGEHSLSANRDDNPMNGISTLDLVLIQKHIMGTELLNTPYKMIAADVNSNNDISAVDLLELRKLVLGIYDKLPESTSWKFIPKSHTFTSNDNPWGYPLEDKLTDMKVNMVSDFIGVKMGDVNSSAAAHSLMGTEIRNAETGLIFEVDDRQFRAGEKVKVEFRSPNFAGISGFQGTLQFTNDHLRFDNVDQSSLVKQSNIGTRWIKEGLLTMSWNENTGIDIPNDKAIFAITFTAQKDGKLSDVLRMGSQRTRAEAYEGKGELGNLSLKFTDQNGKEVSGTNTLYQNYPNPFDHRTTIGINLAHSGKGTLKIIDVTGRVIKSYTREWAKGYQEIVLNKSELGGKGLMYYQFESDYFTANKRMIIMD
ncbi:MAG: hypothetical protein KA143_02615 [Saprospiraceae bacterium]|nr:hypothetical protein [Saprospiraceae bacterium]